MRESGRKFWASWHRDYPDFEAKTSRLSEVAINPEQLFLPKSNNKTLKEQEEMVAKYSQGIKISGVEAILGEVPDYVELAFRHLDKTTKKGQREYLFGEKYDYNYTRTKTPTVGANVALVGHFYADVGLVVYDCPSGTRYDDFLASPLVVPVRK